MLHSAATANLIAMWTFGPSGLAYLQPTGIINKSAIHFPER